MVQWARDVQEHWAFTNRGFICALVSVVYKCKCDGCEFVQSIVDNDTVALYISIFFMSVSVITLTRTHRGTQNHRHMKVLLRNRLRCQKSKGQGVCINIDKNNKCS